ncbi:MAG TPA: NADH-quinone oxidoreductase subunit NuoH [Ktedonobacterales bacterium]|nr:NADH-quinone oxidoreductase subunit NuoH [Ktedonobacterales bacterium]
MSDLAWFLVGALVKSAIAIVALLTAFAYMTLIERRVIARFQRRIGPNRAGPQGVFQPLADALKMAFKEEILPTKASRLVFLLAPAISVIVALTAFAVVPLGGPTTWGDNTIARAWAPYVSDLNVGVLYIFAVASLAVYGIVLAGWSSGNHYSLLGALRSAAQMVSYEVSIALAIAGVLMFAGTLSMIGIVNAQVNQGIWFVLAQPLGLILYGIAAVAEVNRAPFDLPEAEQELVAGYLTEFSGLRWSLFQMAEYINMITASAVVATLFFGGWTLGGLEGIPGLPFIWFFIKVALFLFVFIWLRATLPRIRYDQLMRFGWQTLLPLAALNALATAVVVALGWPWWVSGLFGLGIILIGGAIHYSRMRRGKPEVRRISSVSVEMPASVRLVSGRITPAASAEPVEPGASGADGAARAAAGASAGGQ